ncbi:CysB family HTH-type transcriptional regulator [Uliginosibacterium sp. H1]|uniref:CysB family HTH-type transcriptional regulator n=1 Tax=Uliginosibacterium sp. H1 TaxID=3114757 RepID=UPI002E180047|nr:CysB family HTH-type transcriptional regulator [Uliginosibacterium sp. H1]
MNLQQLRYVLEVARHNLSVSEAADALFTSQPGVSKQIRLLEEELGLDVFVRHGKRLVSITEPGKKVLAIAERMLREADNLRAVADEFHAEDSGRLVIATTHTQARYALPKVVGEFMRRYPKVQLELHQASPKQIAEQVLAGEADLGIATEALTNHAELATLPCHQWNRSVIAKTGHPLLRERVLTLEAIARYPIITYDAAFTGRSAINRAFLARGLKPNIVLTALDSDVIKTYVGMDLGIGIVATMALDPMSDRGLQAVDAAHLFESSTTRVGLPRNAWLRGYVYAFIELFAPQLTRKVVDAALGGEMGSDPGL